MTCDCSSVLLHRCGLVWVELRLSPRESDLVLIKQWCWSRRVFLIWLQVIWVCISVTWLILYGVILVPRRFYSIRPVVFWACSVWMVWFLRQLAASSSHWLASKGLVSNSDDPDLCTLNGRLNWLGSNQMKSDSVWINSVNLTCIDLTVAGIESN